MVGGQWIDLGMGLGGGWWVVGGGLVVLGLGFSGGCFREREREKREKDGLVYIILIVVS